MNKQYAIIPLDFIKGIPYDELCRIARRLAIAGVNENVRAANDALIQLLMEVDMSGKIINLRKEGKHEEADKLVKEQNKSSRDNFDEHQTIVTT